MGKGKKKKRKNQKLLTYILCIKPRLKQLCDRQKLYSCSCNNAKLGHGDREERQFLWFLCPLALLTRIHEFFFAEVQCIGIMQSLRCYFFFMVEENLGI